MRKREAAERPALQLTAFGGRGDSWVLRSPELTHATTKEQEEFESHSIQPYCIGNAQIEVLHRCGLAHLISGCGQTNNAV